MTTELSDIDIMILNHPLIDVEEVIDVTGEFNRCRVFTAMGTRYKLKWFINSLTVITEQHVEMYFEQGTFEITGTWPNGYFTNIQICSGKTYLIIPIQRYEGAVYNGVDQFSSVRKYAS